MESIEKIEFIRLLLFIYGFLCVFFFSSFLFLIQRKSNRRTQINQIRRENIWSNSRIWQWAFPFVFKKSLFNHRKIKRRKKLEKATPEEKIINFSKGERNVSLADHWSLIIFNSMFFLIYFFFFVFFSS